MCEIAKPTCVWPGSTLYVPALTVPGNAAAEAVDATTKAAAATAKKAVFFMTFLLQKN
jgi:hypothetical protein